MIYAGKGSGDGAKHNRYERNIFSLLFSSIASVHFHPRRDQSLTSAVSFIRGAGRLMVHVIDLDWPLVLERTVRKASTRLSLTRSRRPHQPICTSRETLRLRPSGCPQLGQKRCLVRQVGSFSDNETRGAPLLPLTQLEPDRATRSYANDTRGVPRILHLVTLPVQVSHRANLRDTNVLTHSSCHSRYRPHQVRRLLMTVQLDLSPL